MAENKMMQCLGVQGIEWEEKGGCARAAFRRGVKSILQR